MSSEVYIIIAWMSGAAAFGLVICFWFIGLVLFYVRRTRQQEFIQQRLGLLSGIPEENPRVIQLWRDGQTVSTVVPRLRLSKSLVLRLEQVREALGFGIPVGTLLVGLLGAGALAFLVVYLPTANLVLAVAAGAGTVAIPMMIANRRIRRRTQLFENQLADALALATRSLRAGHPLTGAFRLVVEEMDPPVNVVFSEIVQQQELGAGMDEALRYAATRSASPDMKLFAASMIIQLRSGGNLADMMDRLSDVIRDRMRLHRRARVLTAQTELSKNILIAVPVLLFVGLYLYKQDYLEPLYTTFPGKVMMALAVSGLALGSWVMNRIAMLKY